MRKSLYLYIWTFLFADFFSTFWAANGDMSSIIELHFIASVFGQGFSGLATIFMIEGLLLSGLWHLYLNKEIFIKKPYEYKVLRENIVTAKAKQRNFNLIEGIPVFIMVLSVGHLIPAINNILLGLYLREVNYEFVQGYIQRVHKEGNLYFVHVSIGIAALLVVLLYYLYTKNRGQHKRA